MTLREAIKDYQEVETGIVSIYKNPAPRSVDNGLLFTSTYMALLSDATQAEKDWFLRLALSFEIEPGLFARYPGEKEPTSHDDVTGVTSVLHLAASRAFVYLSNHEGFYGTNFLPRILDFWPSLKASAMQELSWGDKFLFCLAVFVNLFEQHQATSGKCLLYLKTLTMEGHSLVCDIFIELWRLVMKLRYKGGMRDVYEIYFGADHPFTQFGPQDFRGMP